MAYPVHTRRRMRLLAAVLPLLFPLQSGAESKNGFVIDDALVLTAEILQGGPPRDGIPSLDYPEFISAGDAGFLKSEDRVLALN